MIEENSDTSGMLNDNDLTTLVVPRQSNRSFRFIPRDITFHPVPYNYSQLTATNRRRLLLKFDSPVRVTIGLDLFGDVVLGRGRGDEDEQVDIDLSNLDAGKLGVSRRHALLRPTPNKLFLIDLESTNGTYVNTLPIGRGMAQEIKSGDTIALAGLSFDVEFVPIPKDDEALPYASSKHHPDLPPGDEHGDDPTNPWLEDQMEAHHQEESRSNDSHETGKMNFDYSAEDDEKSSASD